MNAEKKLTHDVINFMRHEIQDAHGNEVFFVGKIDEDGFVYSVEVASRGQSYRVTLNQEFAKSYSVLLHNHPSGILEPSDADMNIAGKCAHNTQGFFIVDNSVENVYVVVEPIQNSVMRDLDADEIGNLLSANSTFAKKNAYFEERQSQIQLIKDICYSFNDSGVGVFEAGTGVGKSFGYLLPALSWIQQNKERIVVSTGTINLQQQLIEKDIPAAQEIVGSNIKSLLLKGRQNYLCRRRFQDTLAEQDLFSEEKDELQIIANWMKNTLTGSKSDLSFLPKESLWQKINSESDACMGMRCPFHEECFVMKLRKEAADAQLLVVNHHLLFADIESRMNGIGYDDMAVLPPFKRLIFDEAHGIESAATNFFSETLTQFKLLKQIQLLYRKRKGATAGLLFTLEILSSKGEVLANVHSQIESIKVNLELLQGAGLQLLENKFSFRLTRENQEEFTDLFYYFSLLQKSLAEFVATVRIILEGVDEENKDIPAVWETKQILNRIDAMINFCGSFLSWQEKPEGIFWMEKFSVPSLSGKKNERDFFPRFVITPLEIASKMNSGVFEPLETVICTSATLQTNNNFRFWMKKTGLSYVDKERIFSGEYPSPFPYKTNVLFAIPTDAPMPDSALFSQFVQKALYELIIAANGRTLVLFTSYDLLRSAADSMALRLSKNGIVLLKQGDDDRFRLLEKFKNESSTVLFATNSFWEGVDVPGDSLSQVVIVKLPFHVPSDPVFAARGEYLESRGGNAFMELSVPEAIIQFRQGFGRLLRRSSDYGTVVVLDKRLIEKRYGEFFFASIPETKRIFLPLQDCVSRIKDFLEK